MKERPTEGMPDMMPKGTVNNPPQSVPQDIPERMVDLPLAEDYGEDIYNEEGSDVVNQDSDFENDDDYTSECL